MDYYDTVGGGHDPWLWNTPEYGTGEISPGGYDVRTDIDSDALADLSGLSETGDGYAALEALAEADARTTAATMEGGAAPLPSTPEEYRGVPWDANDINCYACAFGGVMGGWMVQHGFMVQVEDKVLPTVRSGRVLAATGFILGGLAAFLWND